MEVLPNASAMDIDSEWPRNHVSSFLAYQKPVGNSLRTRCGHAEIREETNEMGMEWHTDGCGITGLYAAQARSVRMGANKIRAVRLDQKLARSEMLN